MKMDWVDFISIELAVLTVLVPLVLYMSKMASGIRKSNYQNSEISNAVKEVLEGVGNSQKENNLVINTIKDQFAVGCEENRKTLSKLEHRFEQILEMYRQDRAQNSQILQNLIVLVDRTSKNQN